MAEREHAMTPEAISPLHGREPFTRKGDGATRLCELAWRAKINLRGGARDEKYFAAVKTATGVALPRAANTTATHNDLTAFWLGPDEWLLHCELARGDEVMQKLATEFAQVHHAATIVTDYYSVLEIDGGDAAAAIARGCPLDLHARAFKVSDCAQTRFGNASILLHRAGETTFHLQVRWSFAEYVWDYLARALTSLE